MEQIQKLLLEAIGIVMSLFGAAVLIIYEIGHIRRLWRKEMKDSE